MSTRPWPVDPAALALGLVEADELPIAEALLRDDPAFGVEVERLRHTSERLAEIGAPGWSPPPAPRLDLARATANPPEAVATGRVRRRRWRVAFAAVAAAVAIAGVVGLSRTGGPAPPPRAATTLELRPVAGAGGHARLVVHTTGEAELRASGLRPSGTHEHYEAWLGDRRGRMVPMGGFRVGADGQADVHMTVEADLARYAFVDISVEPDGGSGTHSGRSVLRGPL
jgi:anti-sigma-K factor RskA